MYLRCSQPAQSSTRRQFFRTACFVIAFASAGASASYGIAPFRIEVVDKQNGWPVPLVEFRTTHDVVLVTDNAGVIAIDQPELMNRQVWFGVTGHGYAAPADGFGMRGVRLTPKAGETVRVEVERSSIAKRLGRLTGGGIFAESQKCGERLDWQESGVFGCDTVQTTIHRGKCFWLWGDTDLPRYPLGVFDSSSATTAPRPLKSFEPPVALEYDYFTDENGVPRGVAKMPGSGPTWVSGYVSLPDHQGRQRLVATYVKIKPPLEAYEVGLCVWDDDTKQFERLRKIWIKSDAAPKPPLHPDGHTALWKDDAGREWLLFGNPLPNLRCPPTFEGWQDADAWEPLEPQQSLRSAAGDEEVAPHAGSIAWNEYRKRWVTVFHQRFGKPSVLGEVWYAEADAPTGPWGPAVKVLSHDNYTFYNVRLHQEFTDAESPVLLFEGTYTATFADRPQLTPRYDYNQILYRLDLDDAALEGARGAAR
jgi:hypothetical protein